MRLAASACLCLGLASASVALAKCDPTTDPDKADIANARAAVAANCNCTGAATHGAYVSCAAQQANATLVNKSCAGAVKKCAAKSTCGKPGAVTCCVTKTSGTKCRIKRDGAHCTASNGSTACVGNYTSCCDACDATGCVPTPCGGNTCTGTCPGDEVCASNFEISPPSGSCVCFPAGVTPCNESSYPQCGGACLQGHVCQAFHIGPDATGDSRFCACVDPSSTCGLPPPGPGPAPGACSAGPCPPGSACHARQVGGLEVCSCDAP